MIQTYDLDINPSVWLGRLSSVPIERAGIGPSHPYRTPRDLHLRPEFTELANEIRACLPEGYSFISMWANLMTHGNHVALHHHTGRDKQSTLSGCLFLTSGSLLTFPKHTPRVSIPPRPGLLVVFPSSALHAVEPCNSLDRWSLAFNSWHPPEI